MKASGSNCGGKKPIGKIRGAVSELYLFTLTQMRIRELVITNPEFYSIFRDDLDGPIDPAVTVEPIPLPSELAERVAAVTQAESQEMNFQ
jgi:hypothetical protein